MCNDRLKYVSPAAGIWIQFEIFGTFGWHAFLRQDVKTGVKTTTKIGQDRVKTGRNSQDWWS